MEGCFQAFAPGGECACGGGGWGRGVAGVSSREAAVTGVGRGGARGGVPESLETVVFPGVLCGGSALEWLVVLDRILLTLQTERGLSQNKKKSSVDPFPSVGSVLH